MTDRSDLSDALWFQTFPRRQARIRLPNAGEFEREFQTLGPHLTVRRRVLVWRIPRTNPMRGLTPHGLLPVPFLAFADEEISNEDEILMPLLNEIMEQARQGYERPIAV